MRGQEVAVKQRVVARRLGRVAATESGSCGAAVHVRQQSALRGGDGRGIVGLSVRVSGFRGVNVETNLNLIVVKEGGALAVGERHGEAVECTYGTVCNGCRVDDVPVPLPRTARGRGRLPRQAAHRQWEHLRSRT